MWCVLLFDSPNLWMGLWDGMIFWCLQFWETYGAGAAGSDGEAFGPKEPFMGGCFV